MGIVTQFFARHLLFWLAAVGMFVDGAAATAQQPQNNLSALPILGRKVSSVQCQTVTDETVNLPAAIGQGATVVCFLGNDCPMARLYFVRLNAVAAKYRERGVQVVGINSNPQDTAQAIREKINEFGIEFPIVKDSSQGLLDRFSATRTPEVFLLDDGGVIRYHGRIDDQYLPGVSRSNPTRRDLEIALDELLAGQPITVPETQFSGCLIGRIKATSEGGAVVTFTKDVARVLRTHCVECHQPGDIAPFSLVDYEEARGWADMMVEVIDAGTMPPWHASPDHGDFKNERRMPEEDKQILRDWLAAGSPFGAASDDLPPLPSERTGWNLPRTPDLVIPMSSRPFNVPKEGTIDYQYYVVDPGFKEGKWIVGAEIIPGDRSVVHHSIVFIRPPDGVDVVGLGWLAAYVPGYRPSPYPAGHGRWIPAGSKLVFQQHYTPNGRAASDITKIGLVFGDPAAIDHEVFTLMGINQEFEIPPGASDYQVQGRIPYLPRDAKLLGISPHMHYRGKAFRMVGHATTGAEILLDVPRYDFNWQHLYELRTPRPLADFEWIEFMCSYDNSSANRANPDPSQLVTWGDQSWEEMAVVYMDVARPIKGTSTAPRSRQAVKPRLSDDTISARERELAREFVDDFMARFDPRGTGKIPLRILPDALQRFGGLDRNGDKFVTRDEVEARAREHFQWWEERNRD